jgi:hypothetical protein
MPTFKTITFVYRPHEDRVLAAINLGRLDAWSCWLTRRLSLAVLERAETFLAGTSLLAKRAGPTYQGELVAFEQAAAMEATAKAVSPTPRDVLDTCAAGAELAVKLTMTAKGERLLVGLVGDRGGQVTGLLLRVEVQRILRMLQLEVQRGNWIISTPSAPAVMHPAPAKPVRH